MTEILLFHHVLGQTPGFREFADELREDGHTVHTPDLFDGRTFDGVDAGMAHAREIGFQQLEDRATAAAADLGHDLVYAGFSLGAASAQAMTQTRPGARGALLYHGALPTSEFDQPWPSGVPLQMHVMEGDELGDVDVCQAIAEEVESAQLYLYPGSGHLFADRSSTDYDEAAARLLVDRTLAFPAASAEPTGQR